MRISEVLREAAIRMERAVAAGNYHRPYDMECDAFDYTLELQTRDEPLVDRWKPDVWILFVCLAAAIAESEGK